MELHSSYISTGTFSAECGHGGGGGKAVIPGLPKEPNCSDR